MAHRFRLPMASFSALLAAIRAAIRLGCVLRVGASPAFSSGSFAAEGFTVGLLLARRWVGVEVAWPEVERGPDIVREAGVADDLEFVEAGLAVAGFAAEWFVQGRLPMLDGF